MAKNDLFAKFSLSFPYNHKVMPLSDAAFRCLVEATLWSREQLTDGFLPSRLATARWSLEALAELCENDPSSPSLSAVENGYLIHDYAEYQDTKAEVIARRERAKIAGQQGGLAKAKRTAKQPASKSVNNTRSKSVPEVEVEVDTSRHNSEPERIDVHKLVTVLVDALRARGVKTPKSLGAWTRSARLLLDADGRPLNEAVAVLEWAQRDPFWSQNILSMPKFREKYDQLRLKADIKPARIPDDFLRECWEAANIAPIEELTGRAPDCIRWPDPEPADFDKDAFLRDFRRQWITANREELTRALEGRL